jgi:hypothetical protein
LKKLGSRCAQRSCRHHLRVARVNSKFMPANALQHE